MKLITTIVAGCFLLSILRDGAAKRKRNRVRSK